MKRKVFLGFLAAALIAALTMPGARAGETAAGKIDAKAAFEKLKGLAGDWTGTTGQGLATPVTYRVSSNGSVVMETLFPGTEHEMITMYHLVGSDLVATHYCAEGNQPHFKLDLAKSTPTELVFGFDGGTNFDPGKDNHIHSARIAFRGDGQHDEDWAFWAGGKEKGAEKFHLARSAAK
jgi:hypothetical protein